MDVIRRARVEIAGQEESWRDENRESVEAIDPCGRKQELLTRGVVGHEGLNSSCISYSNLAVRKLLCTKQSQRGK